MIKSDETSICGSSVQPHGPIPASKILSLLWQPFMQLASNIT